MGVRAGRSTLRQGQSYPLLLPATAALQQLGHSMAHDPAAGQSLLCCSSPQTCVGMLEEQIPTGTPTTDLPPPHPTCVPRQGTTSGHLGTAQPSVVRSGFPDRAQPCAVRLAGEGSHQRDHSQHTSLGNPGAGRPRPGGQNSRVTAGGLGPVLWPAGTCNAGSLLLAQGRAPSSQP